jgi:hypothetical protein
MFGDEHILLLKNFCLNITSEAEMTMYFFEYPEVFDLS